ncbi:MAG: hypothetical protein WC543_05975 [Candidatus Omnitrophota bacterium]
MTDLTSNNTSQTTPQPDIGQILSSPPIFNQTDSSKLLDQVEKIKADVEKQQANIDKQQADIAEAKARIKETRDLVIFGIVIILLMFGGMLWTAWNERNNSYNSLIEKVYSLQSQLQPKPQPAISQPVVIPTATIQPVK